MENSQADEVKTQGQNGWHRRHWGRFDFSVVVSVCPERLSSLLGGNK